VGGVLTSKEPVFKIDGVENNHTNNPIVRLGRLNVAM
jgi:hypothetical protein